MGTGWLSQTPPAFAASFLANCHWRSVAAGTALAHAGDTDHSMMGIARGTATMSSALAAPETPLVAIAHPGTWFGYVPMFCDQGRMFSLVARSDMRLAFITEARIELLLQNNPAWWRHFATLGVLYGNSAVKATGDLMIRNSCRRCIAALLRLADSRFADPPGGEPITAPLSQEELAGIANLSRTSVSKILQDLQAAGLITLGYRSVILHDGARLRAMVDGI